MNQETGRAWHDALLSGDYPQGSGALIIMGHGPGEPVRRYCCLGVLCDLAVKAGVITELEQDAHPDRVVFPDTYPDGSPSTQAGYLPQKVVEWAGLPSRNPAVVVPGVSHTTLASLNDTGQSFIKIAQIIKDNFLDQTAEASA